MVFFFQPRNDVESRRLTRGEDIAIQHLVGLVRRSLNLPFSKAETM